MAAKRLDGRLIKLHRTYSIADICRTFSVHKNSVRAWMKGGLTPIDSRRPILFLGSQLRAFLERRNESRKRPCRPGTIYCFKCREPRPPALGMVDWEPINTISGNLKALCATCDTIMHRRAPRTALAAVMPGLRVQIVEGQSRLKGSAEPSLNCDLRRKD